MRSRTHSPARNLRRGRLAPRWPLCYRSLQHVVHPHTTSRLASLASATSSKWAASTCGKVFAQRSATRRTPDRRGGRLGSDHSKNRVTDETLKLLVKPAQETGLGQRIDAMFRGDKINITEKRAVLHVALLLCRAVRPSWSMARMSCLPSTPCSIRWPRSANGSLWRVERLHRQANPQHCEHWHRRLGSRPGHGV